MSDQDKVWLANQIGRIVSVTGSVSNQMSNVLSILNFLANSNSSISNDVSDINDTITEQNEREEEAIDNISNQSSSDIPESSDTETTSVISVISGFLSSLQSFQATSCELTLPFPNYAGGSQTVNPCSGKEKAPTIVQVGSSLLLIVTFVPLAFIVLRLIFNEIRSWTNG